MSTHDRPPPPPPPPPLGPSQCFPTLPRQSAPPRPGPPVALGSRASNGSPLPSPIGSCGSVHGVSFLLQIGLTREPVNLDPGVQTLSAVRELVCSIVDQKVQVLIVVCPSVLQGA